MLIKTLTKNVYDCGAKDLLNVVADVQSYPEFIPFCSKVYVYDRVCSQGLESFSAHLLINFKFISENFLTKVVANRRLNTISISGDTKPFKSLIADWSFIEEKDFCKVTFSLKVSFSSFIKERLVSMSFEKIALNIIEAFECRVKG